MALNLEYIKKFMGWCPNAKMLENKHCIHPGYFEEHSRSGGSDAGNSPILPSDWWSKRRNRALIYSGLTLFSMYFIGFQGINLKDEAFVLGFVIGIIFNSILCISDWYFLNSLKTCNKMRQFNIKVMSPKIRVITSIFSLTLLSLLFSNSGLESFLSFISAFCVVAVGYYFKFDCMHPLILLLSIGSMNGFKHMLTFVSGFCLTAFLIYLTAMYWEMKNKKIVLIYGRDMPEIYTVNAGAK